MGDIIKLGGTFFAGSTWEQVKHFSIPTPEQEAALKQLSETPYEKLLFHQTIGEQGGNLINQPHSLRGKVVGYLKPGTIIWVSLRITVNDPDRLEDRNGHGGWLIVPTVKNGKITTVAFLSEQNIK